MRKSIYIFLIIVSMLIINGCGSVLPQDNQDNNTKNTEPVKPSTSVETTDSSDSTEELQEPNDFLTVKETEYTADGEVSSITVYNYYETGAYKSIEKENYGWYFEESESYDIPSKASLKYYDEEKESENSKESHIYYYDEKWRATKCEFYNKNGDLTQIVEYKYDDAGNMIEKTSTMGPNIQARDVYEYNNKNLLLSDTTFIDNDTLGKVKIRSTYGYDLVDNGLPSVKYKFNSEGELVETTKITRNEDNFIIREEITRDDKTYVIEYDRCSLDDYNKNPLNYYMNLFESDIESSKLY